MDALLAQCTREELAVVQFLWSEGSSGAEIHKRLLAQYGDNALSKKQYMSELRSLKVARQV